MVVRTDTEMGEEFSESETWDADSAELYNFIEEVEVNGKTQRIVSSQSGNERNHLFMNQPDRDMKDVSLISGLDSIADSRANAIWDFDHDGYQDIALINANRPFLQLFRNQMGEGNEKHHFVAIQLIGGNDSGKPSDEWSNRDGIGAVLTLNAGDTSLVREARAGEGFASQNSKIHIIGMGPATKGNLSIRWPSGKSIDYGMVSSGQRITCYENLSATLDLSGKETRPYQTAEYQTVSRPVVSDQTFAMGPSSSAPLNLYVSMATWCDNCKMNQPQVKLLRERFGSNINLIGVPVDPNDTAEMLAEYRKKYQPAYLLLDPPDAKQVDRMKQLVTGISDQGGLPSTIMTDQTGRVVQSQAGVPTVSAVAKLLSQLSSD